MKVDEKVKEFRKLKEESEIVSKDFSEKLNKQMKYSARNRILKILDKDSFVELDQLVISKSRDFDMDKKKKYNDGVITGYGTIDGRQVFICSQDFSFMGGSYGEAHAKKIAKLIRMARMTGAPFISINESGGARIQEGVNSLDGFAEIARENVLSSGVIPQISIITGASAGGASYSPALMDFIFMVKESNMFITGPNVIKIVTGEEISAEDLGGANIHNTKSGVAHFMISSEDECFESVKILLSYLPSNNMQQAPVEENSDKEILDDNILRILPDDSSESYNMKNIINELFDNDTFFEVQEYYAPNMIIGFARLNGLVVGIVANQPEILAGCLDINSSHKISRFIRFCDAFNIPLINLVDAPGYLPGTNQEHQGIVRNGAKVLYAYAEATVPKISLVIRKAYGGAFVALCSKSLGYDSVLAWPTAELAVMGAEQAVNIIYRKEIMDSKNKEGFVKDEIRKYNEKFLNPYVAAKEGKIDMIVEPKDTRKVLINMLKILLLKREQRPPRKHGNIPL